MAIKRTDVTIQLNVEAFLVCVNIGRTFCAEKYKNEQLLGDMDGNGNVGAEDALVVLRCAVHLLETRAVKPAAYETYQFSVNGRFQGLTIRPEDVTREAMIAKDKTELSSYLDTYILVGGTTIPREAFDNGELSYVTFRNVSR